MCFPTNKVATFGRGRRNTTQNVMMYPFEYMVREPSPGGRRGGGPPHLRKDTETSLSGHPAVGRGGDRATAEKKIARAQGAKNAKTGRRKVIANDCRNKQANN